MVAVIAVQLHGTKLVINTQYSLFFLLGNEKYPTVEGIGLVNFYMCQFPFDLNRTVSTGYRTALASYDYVLLNSRFSYHW